MSFFGELRRRNVLRVGIAYLAAVWVLLQVADLVLSNLGAPAWIIQVLIVSAALGSPLALVLAWMFEITPDGVRAAAEVPVGAPSRFTGRQVDFAIITLLVLAVGFLVVDNYLRIGTQRDQSIAVLPFTNLSVSQEESAEFFAAGMHDALLTQLAKLGGLRVISRTSVLEYAASPKNIRQIGAELGVSTIMEGSILRAGNNLQINVQLIDAETDEHLWAEIYDRELTADNIFAIQREMATSIAGILRATISSEEQTELSRVPTHSARAYDFYLTGNEFARRPNERENMPLAIQAYERAVAEDPMFALAWAALARAQSEQYKYGADRTEALAASAQAALRSASELSPDAPEIHFAAGQYEQQVTDDYDAAITEYEKALRGLPGSADVFNALASAYRRIGRFDDSIAFRNRAIELDPRNVDALASLAGGTYAKMRDYEAAERTFERALEIAPDIAPLHFTKAQIPLWRDGDPTALRELVADPPIDLGRYGVLGGWIAAIYARDYTTAEAYLGKLEPGMVNERRKSEMYAETYWLAGRAEAAEPYFQDVRRRVEPALAADPNDHRNYIRLGFALAGLGERDAAIEAGRRALALIVALADVDAREAGLENVVLKIFSPVAATDLAVEALDELLSNPGFFSIEGLTADPNLDPIRDDPRFQALVEKYRRQ